METASSALSILPNTKDEVISFSRKLENEIIEGNIDPLEILRYQKSIEAVFKNIKETLDPAARKEAEKYGTKSFQFKGITITLSENGTKYDYSNCNDPEHRVLKAAAEVANEALKARETFLKALKQPMEIIAGDELITIYPPIKTSTSGVKCEL